MKDLAGSPTHSPAILPQGLHSAGAVEFGGDYYIIGGQTSAQTYSDKIYIFDTTGEMVSEAGYTLPNPVADAVVVSDGTDIYVLGGVNGTGDTNNIVKISPNSGGPVYVETLEDKLYFAVRGASGGIYGEEILIFGGFSIGEPNTICQSYPYTLGGNATMTEQYSLPESRYDMTFVKSATYWFFLGGHDGMSTKNNVFVWTPGGTVESWGTPFHSNVSKASGVMTTQSIFVFGGEGAGPRKDIWEFNEGLGTSQLLASTLPTGLMKTAVGTTSVSSDVWYCFGGQAYDEGGGPSGDYWDGIIKCEVSEGGAVQDLEVSVSAPALNDVLTVGEEFQIIINFSNQVEGPSSDIYFSDSSTGGPWELVVNATATIESRESQQYTWTVPNNVSSTCYLKVVTHEKEWEQRVATGYSSKFTITAGAAEPALSSLEMNGKLPVPLKQACAVWHNGSAYIFGGLDDGDTLMDGIYRYDASTDTTTTMGAKLPNAASNLKAVSTDYGIYLYSSPNIPTGKFWVYEPLTDTIDSSQNAPLNTKNMAVYNGQYIYLMGGLGPAQPSFEVWAYEPSTKNLTQYNTPAGATYRYGQTAVLVDDMIYMFGGYLDSVARAESLNIFVMNFTIDDETRNIVIGPDYLLNYDNLENTENMVGYYDGSNIIAFAGTQIINMDIVNGTYKILSVSIPATNDDTALAYDSQGDFAYLFGGGTGTAEIYKFGIDPTIPEPVDPDPDPEPVSFYPSINPPTTMDGKEFNFTLTKEEKYLYEVKDKIKIPIDFSAFVQDVDVKFIVIKIGDHEINVTPSDYDEETWQNGIFDVVVDTTDYENGEVDLEIIYGYSGKNETVIKTYSSGSYISLNIVN